MKQKITTEQRKLIAELLEQGEDRHVIAQRASVTVGQVSAIAAHRTMGRYGNSHQFGQPVSAARGGASSHTSELISNSDQGQQSGGIDLGTDIDSMQVVNWEPQGSSNPHVLILGESGSGKTYTASRLVIELARACLPSIVFDYGQGFSLEHAPEVFRNDVHTVELHLGRDGIAINPLQIFPVDTHGPATVAQRVADTFSRVYPRLGVQQHTLLRRAVLELLAEAGISSDDPRTWKQSPPAFRDLEQKLAEYARTDDATREHHLPLHVSPAKLIASTEAGIYTNAYQRGIGHAGLLVDSA